MIIKRYTERDELTNKELMGFDIDQEKEYMDDEGNTFIICAGDSGYAVIKNNITIKSELDDSNSDENIKTAYKIAEQNAVGYLDEGFYNPGFIDDDDDDDDDDDGNFGEVSILDLLR